MGITAATRRSVIDRAGGRCENPTCGAPTPWSEGEAHHIYWRSQYKGADRDLCWNLAWLCRQCHGSIHHGGNTELDRYLKALADKRMPPESRSHGVSREILRDRKLRRDKYRRDIKWFKAQNGGLSPAQVRYRKLKALKRKKKAG